MEKNSRKEYFSFLLWAFYPPAVLLLLFLIFKKGKRESAIAGAMILAAISAPFIPNGMGGIIVIAASLIFITTAKRICPFNKKMIFFLLLLMAGGILEGIIIFSGLLFALPLWGKIMAAIWGYIIGVFFVVLIFEITWQ